MIESGCIEWRPAMGQGRERGAPGGWQGRRGSGDGAVEPAGVTGMVPRLSGQYRAIPTVPAYWRYRTALAEAAASLPKPGCSRYRSISYD